MDQYDNYNAPGTNPHPKRELGLILGFMQSLQWHQQPMAYNLQATLKFYDASILNYRAPHRVPVNFNVSIKVPNSMKLFKILIGSTFSLKMMGSMKPFDPTLSTLLNDMPMLLN